MFFELDMKCLFFFFAFFFPSRATFNISWLINKVVAGVTIFVRTFSVTTITTTIYSKPKDSNLSLHADSYHKKSSIKGIQKVVALRLRHICSSDNDYTAKSKEYTKYLVNRGEDLKPVQRCFNNVGKTWRQETPKKVK